MTNAEVIMCNYLSLIATQLQVILQGGVTEKATSELGAILIQFSDTHLTEAKKGLRQEAA